MFAINYRFQGVAEKIRKTQGTVLAKDTKVGVRSAKGRWLDLDAKNLIDVRVIWKTCKTQKIC
jgi:hypothetical protein